MEALYVFEMVCTLSLVLAKFNLRFARRLNLLTSLNSLLTDPLTHPVHLNALIVRPKAYLGVIKAR